MHETLRQRAVLLGAAIILTGCSDASTVLTEPGRRNGPAMDLAAEDQPTGVDKDSVQIVRASGDIAPARNEYRTLLGALSPNLPGEQAGERREINWDAPVVPATLTNNDLFPGDFFNVNSPRGVLLTTDGTAFRVSDIGYSDVNPAYAPLFRAFSPRKLIVARGSTSIDVHFVVAGSSTPALVTGFGSVFVNVGLPTSTTLEYFDAAGSQLLKLVVPRGSDARGLSFAGAKFGSAIVARVRITAGDTPIGENVVDDVTGPGEKRDIVALDDFIYGEPRPRN